MPTDLADSPAADPAATRRRPLPGTTIPRIAVIAVAAYIGAQMVSDVASLKIGVVGGLAVDMGTFVYPITFTLRDVVHKAIGRRATRTLIVTAAALNLGMSAYLGWAATITSDPDWGLGEEFSAVLGPLWRIVIASIVAEVVSELLDTEVYHWFVRRVTTRYQWARVLTSNSVSVPVDSIIFSVAAFGWVLPWGDVWDIFIVNLGVKYAVTLASLPLIYATPDRARPGNDGGATGDRTPDAVSD
ncbi:MAG: queuosine precursor transporter [Acidimicrobiales bacterium]